MTNHAGPNQREATSVEIAEIKQYYNALEEISEKKYNAETRIHNISKMSYLGAGFLVMASFVGIMGTIAVNPNSNNPSVKEHRQVEEKLRNLHDYKNQVPSFYFAPELKPALKNLSKDLDNLVSENQSKLEALEKAPDYVQDREWLSKHGDIFAWGTFGALGLAAATAAAQISAYCMNARLFNKRRKNILRPSCLDSQA
ncbi:MAG: hypothetical protein WC979_08110 [Candidatus Pacearchaeota archaeon]